MIDFVLQFIENGQILSTETTMSQKKSENRYFIRFSILRNFHVYMTSSEILKFFDRKTFYFFKHIYIFLFWLGAQHPTPPPGLRPWSSHAFGLRTLASLVSI